MCVYTYTHTYMNVYICMWWEWSWWCGLCSISSLDSLESKTVKDLHYFELVVLLTSWRKWVWQWQPELQLLPGIAVKTFWLKLREIKNEKDHFWFHFSPQKSVNVQKFTMVKSGAFLFCWHCIMRVFLVGLLVTVYNIWTSILDYTVGQDQGWRIEQEDNCHPWNNNVLEQKGVRWITVLLFQHSCVQIPLTYIWSDAGKPGSRAPISWKLEKG